MEPKTGDKETVGVSLQEKLIQFAAAETPEREKNIAGLVEFIMKNVDKDVVAALVDKESQSKLEEAVSLTLQTKFKKDDGSIVDPWQGGHTVVVLDKEGKIKGAVSVPTEGLEDYGDLNKYALIKALCELHLYKSGREELSAPKNFSYLLNLGLRAGENLFTGGAWQEDLNHEVIFAGSSGCAPRKDYLKELLANADPTRDTQAGLFDTVFSQFTAFYFHFGHPSGLPTEPEPLTIRQLRINN